MTGTTKECDSKSTQLFNRSLLLYFTRRLVWMANSPIITQHLQLQIHQS